MTRKQFHSPLLSPQSLFRAPATKLRINIMPLLQVEDLTTHYKTERGWVRAVEGISFNVEEGEAMGLAGESGCGKSTVALTLLKILPSGGRIRGGKIIFDGQDLVKLRESEMRKIRWKGISVVFQCAMNALNPVYKVGFQIEEAIKLHKPRLDKAEVKESVDRRY